MLKNIILIISFVLVCGGLFLFISSNKTDGFIDRNGYATMENNHYVNEQFSFEMDFQPQWIVFDGVTLLQKNLSSSTREQLEESCGASLDNIEFVMGAETPDAAISCLSLNYDISDEAAIKTDLDNIKEAVTAAGGTMGACECRTITDKNNTTEIIMYYYDYKLSDKEFSTFVCYANSAEKSLKFDGTYENSDGLALLTGLIENNISFTV